MKPPRTGSFTGLDIEIPFGLKSLMERFVDSFFYDIIPKVSFIYGPYPPCIFVDPNCVKLEMCFRDFLDNIIEQIVHNLLGIFEFTFFIVILLG